MEYYIYLTDKSTVQASIVERPYDVLIGQTECEPEDLDILLTIAQNAIDATIIQLAEKANNLFQERQSGNGNKDMN